MGAADDLRERCRTNLDLFRGALAGADPDRSTPSGWTVKEMVGHVAFWLETVPPFVSGMWRGDASAFDVTFPSGYHPADDPEWPRADVHNAREAAWAKGRSWPEVRERLDAAATKFLAFIDNVTDDEVSAHPEYFKEQPDHLEEHREELQTQS